LEEEMRFLALPDLHITNRQPKRRCDNFEDAVFHKLEQIIYTSTEYKTDFVIQPGDIFDTDKASHYLVQKSLRCFRRIKNFLCVFGQHDMRYHSKRRDNTPLKVVSESGKIEIIDQKTEALQFGVRIYGASWDQDIPIPKKHDVPNILVLHKMISNRDYWNGNVDYNDARVFLKKWEKHYDVIISGDNHNSFMVSGKKGVLINCGCMMRTKKDQINYKPHMYLVEIEKEGIKTERINFDVLPAEKAFDLSEIEKEEEEDKELESFTEGISEDVEVAGLDFYKNVNAEVEKRDLEKSVVDIINEIMED
jgi:DNA repair exonuclease SbcCD nuclease subunit